MSLISSLVRLTALALLAFASTSLRAETFTLKLRAGQPAELLLDSPLDDADFSEPRSYSRHVAPARHFIQRLTLTNTGRVPLTGPLLIVNGRDWSTVDALRRSLALPAEPRNAMPRLFAFWRDHISHADSGCKGLDEPLALLNFWGYALCGDTTSALMRLATSFGIPARNIPLNGHVAAEYFYDGAWHIFDADQNVCYLRLDNRTLASAADLRADPFLALRTKAFGRHAAMKPAAMAFNTSLHEHIDPHEEEPEELDEPLTPVRAETLLPGESMLMEAEHSPAEIVGRADLMRWGKVREASLRTVEWVLDVASRRDAQGVVKFESGAPILHGVNHTTHLVVTPPTGEAVFEISIPTQSRDDRVSVVCQRSRVSMPLPYKGRNIIALAATNPAGAATLNVMWEPLKAVTLRPPTAEIATSAPTFRINTDSGAEALWWQISAADDFAFVPPNFDAVIAPTGTLRFDLRTATFFDPAQPYFLRVKSRRDGAWSAWSAPLRFTVEKPARPAPVKATVADGRLRLAWPSAGEGAEYLVFASDRLDFIPEVFADEEIVAMREQTVELVRPNKNQIAAVTESHIEMEPTARYYRIIARRAGALSVPSELIATPSALAGKLPPAKVLQTRWRTVEGADEYTATEQPLP
jgi:hypothetical protein